MEKLERLERIADRMDSIVRIPGTRIRLGLDSILGFVPAVGDVLALAPAAYIIHQSHKLGAPKSVLARQAVNTGVDTLIGTIPFIGDLFDIGNKSNKKNVALLRAHLENKEAGRATGPFSLAAR